MTRINLVDPKILMDQHLFAEFREIKMVPKALNRSLKTKTSSEIFRSIPSEFTLNSGHVKFFFDKGKYLRNRYEQIKDELRHRGVWFDEDSAFDPDGFMLKSEWNNDYLPDDKAFDIIKERITTRIKEKPDWYRYMGESIGLAALEFYK